MQPHASPSNTGLIPGLRAAVAGRVLAPGDPGYEDARIVADGSVDARPAAIVQVADAADVAAVIAAARATGLELAVRSGGHGAAGIGTVEGGIVADLRGLTGLEIDVAGRTAWAGTGLSAGAMTRALAGHGLAVGFGDTGSVGIGGITLGGGVGYLVRKHGLTIDSLLAAEVVTASGELVTADEDHHPDLFWAIRGGGGNFGVATRFRFRLHELGGVTGGLLVLPATAATVAGFIAAAEDASDDVSAIVNVLPAPPLPFLPAQAHGQVVILASLVHAGRPDDAPAAIAPFRALATPLADMVRPMSYPDIYPPEDASYRPTAVARTLFLDGVDRDAAATIVERLRQSDAAMRAVQLRVLGGAMARVPAEATAFAHRTSRIMANVASFYSGAEDRAARAAWVDELAGALRGRDQGAYVGFIGDEGPERVRAAYPGETWDRLTSIKRRYDPGNVFRRNQNIPPAPDGPEAAGAEATR